MTTAVDRPNRAKLQQGIDIYRDHVREFIIRELRRVKGSTVKQLILDAAARNPDIYARRMADFDAGKDPKTVIDVSDFPHIVGHHWRQVFRNDTASRAAMRNRMYLIAEARNQVAHPDDSDITAGFVSGRLDDIARVLRDINAPAAAKEVEEITEELYPITIAPLQSAQQKVSDQEPESKAGSKSNGLKQWRDVISPHPDVISGEITNSTFAADLQQVADAESAYDEYTSPIGFFNRSVVTPGLKSLLINNVKRINGLGGEPVVQMKTGFGGGKTHSLIALYHLINSAEELAELATDPSDRTGDDLLEVFDEAGINPKESVKAKVAVLHGTTRSATERTRSSDGDDPLNTLWGYMANELGGKEAYEFVRLASEQWTSPGRQELDDLFEFVGPCVILIDELVAYARNLHDDDKKASFYTFLQALTESASRQQNVAIVVTVPAAADQMGGPAGVATEAEISRVLGRVEAISAPLETHEAFEVVRRRLFEDTGIDNEELERTADAFGRMYTRSRTRKEFPRHASNPTYRERIKACYPIHPEVFDRLFEDWVAIPDFQRTRGVLRLIAVAIRRLNVESNDPLIMPGSLRFDDNDLSQEFIKLLGVNWGPAVDEIDGVNSRANGIDDAVERFQRCSGGAAKRVARTIMLGSVPASVAGKTSTGLDEQHIRLGTVQPNEGVSVYNDARNQLARDLYYLHHADQRYFIHASANLTKVHQDIIARISGKSRDERIGLIINEAVPRRIGDDVDVVVCPEHTYEVRDDDQVKLVILAPSMHLPSGKAEKDTATPFCENVMAMYGDSRRIRRNTVAFVVARRKPMTELRREVANLMAWEILSKNREGHRLSHDQSNEAKAQTVKSGQLVDDLLLSAYGEVIDPTQLDPTKPNFRLQSIAITNDSQGSIATNAIETLKRRGALVDVIAHNQFEAMLKNYFWRPEIDHLEISEIWNSITQQVYLPRLINRGVLETAINKAVKELDYEIADGYEDDHYMGLSGSPSIMDRPRLLVKGEAARTWRQLQAESKPVERDPDEPATMPSDDGQPSADTAANRSGDKTTKKLVSVSASKTWIGQAAIDGDYNQVRDYMVKSLENAGGSVRVTITIEGNNPDGFAPLAMNSIAENSEQLDMQIEFGD